MGSHNGVDSKEIVVRTGIPEQSVEKYLDRIVRFRPLDDTFMRMVLKDNLFYIEYMLRTLTLMDDLVLSYSETQRDVKVAGARSIVCDVYGVDSKGTLYDLEVQRSQSMSPKRPRYSSAILDAEFLRPGWDFSLLHQQWVIFIMEHYPFSSPGTSLFERRDSEGNPLDDGTHILYADAMYEGDDELGRLMADLRTSDPEKIANPLLRERVNYYKNVPEGVSEMCEIMEELCDEARKEGIEKGREQERQKLEEERKQLEEERKQLEEERKKMREQFERERE